MFSFDEIDITVNSDGWGPVASGDKSSVVLNGVPYAHFDKKDRISRFADFSQSQQQRQYRFRRDENSTTEFSYRHDAVEDSTFQLVDSAKTGAKKYPGNYAYYFTPKSIETLIIYL